MWSDSDNRYVYLASDPDEAYSYAETALDEIDNEKLYDMLENDEIVVLETDTKYLDKNKLFKDKNVIDGETTYQYEGIINCQNLRIYNYQMDESLVEDVRPQYLYHGTTFEYAKEIMWSNTIEGTTDIGNEQYGVSLTRNLSYAKDFADYKADVNGDYGIVIFELDYEKLKHHYKIRPYYDLLDMQRASNGDKLKYNEYEEVVIGDIQPLSQYIKNIYVDDEAQEQIESNDEYIEYFGNAKTFDGIEIVKSHFNKDMNNQINEVLKLAGVKLDEREDLTKFNRIAGFYHLDTKEFELFPRTSEDISTEDDEINDYIHNVHSKDEFTEFHIVRFGIEDIPGEGVVCYIEGDTKRHAEDCYYAIMDEYAEDLDIIKYELEYYIGNKQKMIVYDRYGNKRLNEEILDAKAVGDDLMNIILKNPTRRELRDNKMNTCRGALGRNGNFYFIEISDLAHCDLFDTLEKMGINEEPYHVFKYSNKTNTFYYYDPDNDLDEEEIKKELESSPHFKSFAGCHFDYFDDLDFDPDLYESYNPLNESYDRMNRPFIWNDPTYSQFHRILRDNTTYGKLSAIIDNGHIYCWDSALSHHDSVVKDIEESGIKLSDDYIWVRFKEPNLCWVSAAYFDDYTDEDLEDLPQQDFEKELEENPIIKKYFPQGVKIVRFDSIMEKYNESL